MAISTKIIVQQAISVDPDNVIVGKYPRYIINMGTSISSITATELATAVDQAQTAAANAKESEINSKESETNSKASEIAAKGSEDAAKISEDNSKASEIAAKASEDAAKISETNSKTSEDNAAESKRLAELAQQGAKTAETNAKASEVASKTSEDNAKASELAAKTSEDNAKTSETNAGVSEGNAETDAIRAEAAADRAEAIVDSKLDKVDISKFFKGYQTKEQADADVASRVAGEKILVWNQDGPKYSWYVVKDTAGVLSLELESDEQKMVSVNNIRPDNLGNVQVTIPGGNPSLWLGEVTWFPYDKDNTIGYSGILLADGREVRRVDYPDTWTAIETGLIPSVTDAEWLAGQNMYFSTGDGSTTFRLPNLLQGQAFRAAMVGEDGTSQIQEQIPFITTVNGVSPEDASGAVVIGITNLEGTLPVSQGGTGATDAGAARDNLGLGSVSTENTVPLTKGGTGATDADTARTNLGLGSVSTENTVPLSKGGTGGWDAGSAKVNLGIDRVKQGSAGTSIFSANATQNLFINDTPGDWGVWDGTANAPSPLAVHRGGTGATSASAARLKLESMLDSAGPLGATDLNTLKEVNQAGHYYQNTNANATPENNYPPTQQQAGSLVVTRTGVGGVGGTTGVIQEYTTYWDQRKFIRSWDGATWKLWKEVLTENTPDNVSRSALNLDRFKQFASETNVYAPNGAIKIFLQDNGNWGLYNDTTRQNMPLPVATGGTGATNVAEAARSLNTIRLASPVGGSGFDYNDLNGDHGAGGLLRGISEAGGSTNHPTNIRRTAPLYGYGGLTTLSYNDVDGVTSQMYISHPGDVAVRMKWGGVYNHAWQTLLSNGNTTIDGNGFIKVASPIIKLKGDGSVELNLESEGASAERIDIGVYKISGVLGFNSDPAWGGIDGGVGIPQNSNGMALLWVDSKVLEDGSIMVYSYHRDHKDAPSFASNIIEGISSGDPIDIPVGRWIDLRVEMPEDSIYNLNLKQLEDSLKSE